MSHPDIEARRTYARRYYAEHRDTILAQRRSRKATRSKAERERDEERRKARNLSTAARIFHPHVSRSRAYARVSANKRRAAASGTHFTFDEWMALRAQYAGRCAYCGSTDRIEADHRVPLYRGGTNEIDDMLPACRHCNRRKHRKTEEEFRALLAAERTDAEI